MKKIIALILLIITITGITVKANDSGQSNRPFKPYTTQKPPKIPRVTEKPVNRDLINRVLNTAYDNLKLSEAEYKAMTEKFEIAKPFTKLLKRQEMHVDMLLQLYKAYGLNEPKEHEYNIRIPKTVDEYYRNALEKEKNLIEMYKGFLKEDLPQDVRSAVSKLVELSSNNARVYRFILEAKAKSKE